jgi:plastocyanin domain-containing protein
MEWYWWVLIAVAVAAIGVLKLKVWKLILQKRKQQKLASEHEDEE